MFFPSPKHFQHVFFCSCFLQSRIPTVLVTYFSEAECLQIQQFKTADIYSLLFSVDQVSGIGLVGWLWLRVSLEVAVKRCHRVAIISRLSEAERSTFHLTFTWLLADLSTYFSDDFLFFIRHTHAGPNAHLPHPPALLTVRPVFYTSCQISFAVSLHFL